MSASPNTCAKQVHDHRDGVCNLPDVPVDVWWGRPGDCTWEPDKDLYYGPGHGCGCWMCTDQPGRKARARRDRRDAKALCRRIRYGLAFHEEIDDLW